MRSVFGVDPGLAVGLLRFEPDTGFVEMTTLPPLEAADWVSRRVRAGDLVATERFTPGAGTARRTRQNDALEVIGMLRWIAYRSNATLLLQSVSDAVKVAPNDVLRALNWWRRGDPDHVRRAAAQAAYALHQTRPELLEKLVGPGTIV